MKLVRGPDLARRPQFGDPWPTWTYHMWRKLPAQDWDWEAELSCANRN